MSRIALAVHGGAWDIPDTLVELCAAGVGRALELGWQVLEKGGSALDACEQAVVALEDNPVFDAGVGSHLNRDGRVQLDAILMDGATLKSGAVAAVERLRHPVRVARLVLDRSAHMLLVGPGAEQFAIEQGIVPCNPAELVVARETERWYRERAVRQTARADFGTVGAVALDAKGNVAAATSTGGTPGKYPGRVGDSPLVGCGCYADNLTGAVSTTGDGEGIMKVVLGKGAIDLLRTGNTPQVAAERAVAVLGERAGRQGGLILIDHEGRFGAAFSTPRMAYAFRSDHSEAVVRV